MNEKLESPIGVGLVAIITVLLVVVLAVFSCLTLSTAQADLALSQRGAETVQHYYEADGRARELLAAFEAGQEASLETIVPLDEMLGLYVKLQRGPDGQAEILAWQTIPREDFTQYTDRILPVWTGDGP